MVSYQYDAASNRTRLTWPDAFFVTYAYDAINRLTAVSQSGTTTLASYAYDAASRRTGLTYGNTAAVAYSYTANNDLTNLNQTFSGSTANFTYTYNNVHQRASQTVSNAAYHFAPPAVAGSVAYTPNVVNQYTQVAGITQT